MTGARVDVYALPGAEVEKITPNDWEIGTTSPKFDTVIAYKLHCLTLESFQDDDCGNTDWRAWYARFDDVHADGTGVMAVLVVDGRGFVSAQRYDAGTGESEWARLAADWEAAGWDD